MNSADVLQLKAIQELPESVRAQVASVARLQQFADREIVFDQDDEAHACYAIVSGTIRFSRRSGTDQQLLMSLFADATWFGETSLLDGLPRNMRVTAVGPIQLLAVDRADFLGLMQSSPAFNHAVIGWVCRKLRSSVRQTYATLSLPLKTRLARELLALAKSHGVPERGGNDVRIAIKLSQEDLSGMLGATRQRINQLLRSWQSDGLISLEGRSIVLLQQAKLDELGSQGELITS